MVFTCITCLKHFKTNWHLQRHNNRKIPCKQPNNYFGSKKSEKSGKIIEKSGNKNEKSGKENENCITTKNNEIKPINMFICMYCSKHYNNKYSKYKHQKKCKNNEKSNKKEENLINIREILKKIKNTDKSLIIEDDILKLKKTSNLRKKDEVLNKMSDKLLTKKIVNITNNNTTNNNNSNNVNNNTINNTNSNNNTIIVNHINPFGKENLESLSLKTIKKIFSKKYSCLNTALKEIYSKIPENNNFHLANKGNCKYMKLYNGKKCIYERTNKFKTRLSDNTMNHLEILLEENKDKIIKKHREVIEKVIDEYFGGKLTERYDDEVELFIMNHTDEMKNMLTITLNKMKNC